MQRPISGDFENPVQLGKGSTMVAVYMIVTIIITSLLFSFSPTTGNKSRAKSPDDRISVFGLSSFHAAPVSSFRSTLRLDP
jgi:hypothetical protein